MKVKERTLKSIVLYNYRYVFAYILIFVFAFYFLCWRLGSLLPGLSQPELIAATRSSSLESFIQLPLYPLHSLLQWISLHVLGVTSISIRLPSIILAATTALLLYILLKKWFGKVTAQLATTLLLSADWFLYIARLGTGGIEFSLWFVLLIFSLMKLIEKKTNWLLMYGIGSTMLLFIPYGIYAVITTTVCMFACGMFRKRVAESKSIIKALSVLSIVVGLILVTLLSIRDTEFLKSILGITAIPSVGEYMKNFVINSSGVAILWPDNNPLLGPSGVFLVRYFEFVFMLFGLVMLWMTRVNRLSIVILANAVVLAIVSGLNPGSRGGSLLIVPAAIFMTAGIRHFIHRWQRTFPRNPYAKVTLLVPLILLVTTTTLLHYQSYFILWPRQTATHTIFNSDFKLIKKELGQPGICAVTGASKQIETLLLLKSPKCTTTFHTSKDAIEVQSGQRIISKPQKNNLYDSSGSSRSLSNSDSQQNVRWIVSTN